MAKDVTIYIDGRPSRVSGEQLNALLSSIQGDNIARIEVFTNSSSRYDAAGLAIADAEEHLRHINTQDIEVWSAKADFSTPVWKNAKMDIGAKSAGTTIDNDLVYEQQSGGSWNVDTDRTNNFVYSETIHAGYVSVNQNLGKVNIQVGLRGEHTSAEGNQRTTSEVNQKSGLTSFLHST